VKLLVIGGLVGLIIGVGLTVFYFSLTTFFGANTKALNAVQKVENAKKNAAEATATKKERKAHAG
jgi:hypothetical protein